MGELLGARKVTGASGGWASVARREKITDGDATDEDQHVEDMCNVKNCCNEDGSFRTARGRTRGV